MGKGIVFIACSLEDRSFVVWGWIVPRSEVWPSDGEGQRKNDSWAGFSAKKNRRQGTFSKEKEVDEELGSVLQLLAQSLKELSAPCVLKSSWWRLIVLAFHRTPSACLQSLLATRLVDLDEFMGVQKSCFAAQYCFPLMDSMTKQILLV